MFLGYLGFVILIYIYMYIVSLLAGHILPMFGLRIENWQLTLQWADYVSREEWTWL